MTKRDTFVRYIDPLKTIWVDAEDNLHFSVVNALKAVDLEDTAENREAVKEIFRKMMDMSGATIVERAAPDNPDYWTQVHPDDRPPEFRHLPYEDPT